METASKRPGKVAKNIGLLGLGLCALCCALPIIGIVGGAGVLSLVALYAEKVALVLLIISSAALAVWLFKRRLAPPVCSIDCACKADHSNTPVELKTKQ